MFNTIIEEIICKDLLIKMSLYIVRNMPHSHLIMFFHDKNVALLIILIFSFIGYVTNTRSVGRDRARHKLFKRVDDSIFERPTYKSMMSTYSLS